MGKKRAPRSSQYESHLPRHVLMLALVGVDKTFGLAQAPGQATSVWLGKCIHCRSPLVVDAQGRTDKRTTIEHIVPQAAGGLDVPSNLALACVRCNNQKGTRLDGLGLHHPRLVAVIERLQAERRKRWRVVPKTLVLPKSALVWLALGDLP